MMNKTPNVVQNKTELCGNATDKDFPMGSPWKTQLCEIRINHINTLEDTENISKEEKVE